MVDTDQVDAVADGVDDGRHAGLAHGGIPIAHADQAAVCGNRLHGLVTDITWRVAVALEPGMTHDKWLVGHGQYVENHLFR